LREEAQWRSRGAFREYPEALDNVDSEALTTSFYHRDFSTDMGGETLDLTEVPDRERSLKSVADIHFQPESNRHE
jgi:hypothetical protein